MVERIRWGILSTASIGVNCFIPGALKARNCEVVAIGSRDGDRAHEVAARFVIPRTYGSYDALLADPDVDAIYNPLPNGLHADWTLKAAQAGKAILVEKPSCRDAAEAAALANACATEGVVLMEAFMYRFHPQHERVRALLAGGAIGELCGVQTAFSFHMQPLDPGNVRLQAPLAGGALMDVGCYPVSGTRAPRYPAGNAVANMRVIDALY
jgi:predicted dehydrogenase